MAITIKEVAKEVANKEIVYIETKSVANEFTVAQIDKQILHCNIEMDRAAERIVILEAKKAEALAVK